jgi:uncharacterized protein with PIN domain
MGYDALLFREKDDGNMIKIALAEDRVVLTRDTQVMKRRLVANGRLKAELVEDDDPKMQLRQVVNDLKLDYKSKPFSICLECNLSLERRDRDEVRDRVPPYVYKTQSQYMECPSCNRIYWQGTHWEAMSKELENFISEH